jgi:hypothetical protein
VRLVIYLSKQLHPTDFSDHASLKQGMNVKLNISSLVSVVFVSFNVVLLGN